MKAPRTIYLTNGDYEHTINFEEDIANGLVLWCQDKITEHDVEYIRKDLYDSLKKRYDGLKAYNSLPWPCDMSSDGL